MDFYPSISEELVIKSLNFAETYTNVPAEDLGLIRNACKSVLCEQGNLWRKKRANNNNSLFDVAQGSYMGAELCELVGLFLLDGLKNIFGLKRVGLYRDDIFFCLYRDDRDIHFFLQTINKKKLFSTSL